VVFNNIIGGAAGNRTPVREVTDHLSTSLFYLYSLRHFVL